MEALPMEEPVLKDLLETVKETAEEVDVLKGPIGAPDEAVAEEARYHYRNIAP